MNEEELKKYFKKVDDSMKRVDVISQRVDLVNQRVGVVDQIVGQHGDQLNHIESTLYPKIKDQGKTFSVSLSSNPVVDELRQINNWLQQINNTLTSLDNSIQTHTHPSLE